MKEFTLESGAQMPAVGLGTFLMTPHDAEAAVTAALQAGYSLIDTANAYMNEKAVGRGMKASGKARSDIFLSTKLWPSVYQRADAAIDETLARLGTDYIDLFDFELTQDDLNDIATVNKNKRYYTATKEALEGYLSFAPDFDEQE